MLAELLFCNSSPINPKIGIPLYVRAIKEKNPIDWDNLVTQLMKVII